MNPFLMSLLLWNGHANENGYFSIIIVSKLSRLINIFVVFVHKDKVQQPNKLELNVYGHFIEKKHNWILDIDNLVMLLVQIFKFG